MVPVEIVFFPFPLSFRPNSTSIIYTVVAFQAKKKEKKNHSTTLGSSLLGRRKKMIFCKYSELSEWDE